MVTNQLKHDFEHTLTSLDDTEVKKLHGATILMTGCAGFLGCYFSRFFQYYREALGIKKVIGLDNFMLGLPKWVEQLQTDQSFDIAKFDIINDKISSVEGAEEVNYVIHMASIASPVFYRQYPIETLDANIWGLRSLLDFYADKEIRGFLFFSSSEIYGDPAEDCIPIDEEYRGNVSCTGPRACYDEAKRFGETMCSLFSQKHKMPIGVVRPFNNYGPGMKLNDKRVPADFAKSVFANKDIEILSNGSPTRTFCYVADAIAGYLKVLLHGEYDYFNIGIDSPEITISQLAEIYVKNAGEMLDYTGVIKYSLSDDSMYLTDNPQRRCPDISKARNILNYNPTIGVNEGVARFLNFINEANKEELEW